MGESASVQTPPVRVTVGSLRIARSPLDRVAIPGPSIGSPPCGGLPVYPRFARVGLRHPAPPESTASLPVLFPSGPLPLSPSAGARGFLSAEVRGATLAGRLRGEGAGDGRGPLLLDPEVWG